MSADTTLPLVPCPICGRRDGYLLDEGSTFRWWTVNCRSCETTLGECRSDQNSQFGVAPPTRFPAADAQWNAVGAYAEGLRVALEAARRKLRGIAEVADGETS